MLDLECQGGNFPPDRYLRNWASPCDSNENKDQYTWLVVRMVVDSVGSCTLATLKPRAAAALS